jgi:hypothetical protein
MRHRLVVLLAVMGLLVGCGPTVETGSAEGPGGDDKGDGNGNGNGGNTGDDGNRPDAGPAPTCGGQEEVVEFVEVLQPPDMLVVLDRSDSMSESPDGNPWGDPTKWDVMEDALINLTTAHDDDVRFGLSVFPTDGSCGVSGAAVVMPGDNTASTINQELNNLSPNGLTPAHLALEAALGTYQSLPSNPVGQYVLFATDGMPNCGDDGEDIDARVVQAIEDLAAAGIKTYVLGFGSTVGSNSSVLNSAALAGGVPRPNGPPHYYYADDASNLSDILGGIATTISETSCSYALTDLPPNPEDVTVKADDVDVPRDPSQQNGWDYYPDASTITFFGDYCADIKGGGIENVEFSFACVEPKID